MNKDKVVRYPCYKVVHEGAFDGLMERVGRKELVDVRTRKLMSEGLTVY